MEPRELAKKCVSAINFAKKNGFTPVLILTVPEGNSGSEYRQPFGRKGPKGAIVQWGIPEGCDTCKFDPVDVLAWLAAQGHVKVIAEGGE